MSHGHPLDRYIGDAYPDLEDPRAVAAFERIPYDERIAVQSTYEALRVGASLAPDEPAIHFLLRGEPEEEPLTLTYRQRSEEHTSELQSRSDLVCRLLLDKKNATQTSPAY